MLDASAVPSAPTLQATLRTRTLLWAPRPVTIIVLMLAGLAFIWSLWSLYPALLVLQGGAALGTYLDEDWFEIGYRWLFVKRHYEP